MTTKMPRPTPSRNPVARKKTTATPHTTRNSHAAIQAAYAKAKTANGFKRVCVWVPGDYVEGFRKTVARLRRKWEEA